MLPNKMRVTKVLYSAGSAARSVLDHVISGSADGLTRVIQTRLHFKGSSQFYGKPAFITPFAKLLSSATLRLVLII